MLSNNSNVIVPRELTGDGQTGDTRFGRLGSGARVYRMVRTRLQEL